MSRFSLRNQAKIEKALGKPYLELLLKSLKHHFATSSGIEEEYCYKLSSGEGGNMVVIPTIKPESCSLFQFVVIGKTYDVFNLAYYATTN